MDTEVLVNKKQSNEAVFNQLKQYIADIIGEDVVEQIGVTQESIFTKDLEMDSIEIVSFAEKVKGKYGREAEFISWLSSMEFQDLLNLSVGQVTEYIANGNYSNK